MLVLFETPAGYSLFKVRMRLRASMDLLPAMIVVFLSENCHRRGIPRHIFDRC